MVHSFMLRICITALIFFQSKTTCVSQNNSTEVFRIDAKAIYSNNNEIVIRWVPYNYKTWLWGRDSGFVLQRMTLECSDTLLEPTDMNSSIINVIFMPKPQSDWESAISIDSVVGIAAGAYFSDSFLVIPPGTNGIFSAYNIASEKENRFGFSLFAADISTLAAQMQNLYYRDTQVSQSCKYIYSIGLRGNLGASKMRLGSISIDTSSSMDLPLPIGFSIVSGDSSAILSWNQASTSAHYVSYNVYRSDDNGSTYNKINQYPITPMEHPTQGESDEIVYYCALPDNTLGYKFKVCGHSPFGIDGPFTTPLTVKGTPAPLEAPISITETLETPEGVKINWQFPMSLSDKLIGFNITRASEHNGEFSILNQEVISNNIRTFTDVAPTAKGFYKVEYIDLQNNRSSSVPQLVQLADSIPPSVPLTIYGSPIGADGTIKLTWEPSKSNDVMGYRVFMADQQDGEYGQITSSWIKDTFFYHRVNSYSLSQTKYFKIKAVDFRENSSEFSTVAIVSLNDIVPPSPPLLKNVQILQDAVFISFVSSSSIDIQSHSILRKKKDAVIWDELITFDSLDTASDMYFYDSSATKMQTYEYMVVSHDNSGLSSNSRIISIKALTSGGREKIIDFDLKFIKSQGTIKINWNYGNLLGISNFSIYRGTDPDKLYEVISVLPQSTLIGGVYAGPNPFNGTPLIGPGNGQITPNEFNLQQLGYSNSTINSSYKYDDKGFSIFKIYYYAIVVSFEDGTHSPMSEIKSVKTY